MRRSFNIAKDELLWKLSKIRRCVESGADTPFGRWQELTRDAAHYSIAVGAEVPLFVATENSIDVVYPARVADDDHDHPRPFGWERRRYWVIRDVPTTPRQRRWMHALLTCRITPLFEAIDAFDWYTRASSDEHLKAASEATGLRGLLRRETPRPHEVSASAVKILTTRPRKGRPRGHRFPFNKPSDAEVTRTYNDWVAGVATPHARCNA